MTNVRILFLSVGLLVALPARATTPLPINLSRVVAKPLVQYYPTVSISGGTTRTVFWDNQPPAEAWYFNIPALTGGLVTSPQREPKHPDHQGDWAVFEDTSFGVASEISLKDLQSGVESRITTNLQEDYFPSVAWDRLAWQRNLGTPVAPRWDLVFKLNGSAEVVRGAPCGNQSCDETRPQIWDSFIVHNRTSPGSGDLDVFMYDIVSGAFTAVAAYAPGVWSGHTDGWPHIWDNRVVFQSDYLDASHPRIYYRNISLGALGPELPVLVPEPPVCAGYYFRPRVGGDGGRYTIFRAVNCVEAGVPIANALYLSYITSTGVQHLYFIGSLGPNHPDSEPTDYDVFGNRVTYSNGQDIIVVDIKTGSLPPY